MDNTLSSFEVQSADHKTVSLSRYSGQVVLIVNVASRCGYTPQYKGLEELYQKYKDKGLMILGFPCNQFGAQEPGNDSEIQQFCSLNFGVSFPVMAKIEVNGANTAPLYQWLKSTIPGVLGTEAIKWNFTKFLIDRSGKVVDRFAPMTEPRKIERDVENLL